MILEGYISGVLYGLLCLIIALVLYKLGVPKKYTRKVVHILVGFEWVFLYNFLGAGVHFLIVCVLFTVLLAVSYKGNFMPMISSDEDNAPGTVYYGFAMTGVAIIGCFVPEIMLPFGIGIFCTSIGDGLAGLFGQLITNHNPKIYKNKTLIGSLVNFVFSFLSAVIMSRIFSLGINIWQCLAIAVLSVGLELVVGFGLDNIAITWGVTALAYAFMYFPGISNYIMPILMTPFIVAFVSAKGALTLSGLVAAVVLDIAVSISLGNYGFLLLLSFFAFSIVVDKIKKHIKNNRATDEGLKGDNRDYMQVFANGLIPTLMGVLVLLTGKEVFVVAYVASLAEALADTVGSGIGAFSKKTFDPFRFRACDNGISGGMSIIGTVSSLAGSVLIALIGLLFNYLNIYTFLVAAGAGFVGSVFDSFLGSLFQVKYRCSVCGKITEKHIHCYTSTKKHSGFILIDNDVVNLLSSLFAAGLAITVCYLIQ